jgi:HSP20 family protein
MTDSKSKETKETTAAAETEKTGAPAPSEGIFGMPSLFTSLESMRDQMDRLFQSFSAGWPSLAGEGPLRERRTGLGLGMMPKVETSEDDKQFEISVELPGVDEKDVSVSVDDGVLTIKGEKKSEREEKKKDYHLTERSYGSFQRSFQLPENANQDKISADFENGVLKIALPKAAGAKAGERKISITKK